MSPLKTGKRGSKILLTTRMKSVAEMIGKVMERTEEPMNLQEIEWSEYLSLFNKHAFAGVNLGDHKKLQLIGEQIATKLGQSPLLAKTVGGMLNSNLSFEFWEEVLENGVFNSIQNDEDFQQILRLNYIHLSPQLQHCFRYCSIFPQDYVFDKDELVRLWMAVGLIQQSEDKKRRPEDIGGEYFGSLLRKSFFNIFSNGRYYVIHDLLHEMVCSVSKDECLGVDSSKPIPTVIPPTLRHLSIMVDDPLVLSKVPRLGNLHSLVLKIHEYDHTWDDILNRVVKGFKNLRVLKLESSQVADSHEFEFLNAIGHLKHLRYLDLGNFVDSTQLSKSVRKLYHLQTMIAPFLDPSIGSMGEDMRSLINLRHLILPSDVILTIAEIGKLTSLQELDEFYVGEGNGHKIGALKRLRELRGKLCINNLENVTSYEDAMEAELLYKKYLRSLRLQWGFDSNITPEVAAKVIDGLQPHSSLENLEIDCYSGADPPCWLATQDLNMLESITLRNCKNLRLLPPLEKLPFLKFFSLQNMEALTEVGHSFRTCDIGATAFPSLEVLKFDNIPQLDKWSGVEDGPWFPCLKNLTIIYCSGLVALPSLPLSLERLEIAHVGLTTLPRLQQCQNNDCKSPSPSKLRRLVIVACPKLTSLAGGLLQHTDHFMHIKDLYIKQCKELVHMPVEGFQKLISLRSLNIKNCPRLQRHNAPHDDFFLPSSVRYISMMDCGHMGASLPGAMQHLASLSELYLHECTSITSFPSAEVFRRLEKLHHLSIRDWTELTSLGGLQALISLKWLTIKECPKLVEAATATPPLTSDPDEGEADGSSLSLNILVIDDPSLLHLKPLRSLESVQHVELLDCSRLTSLPEEWLLRVRSSLQVLRLHKAVSLRSLPVSFKELSSLQTLEFKGFPLLQSLPELPNSLKTLRIHDCDSKLENHLLGQDWNRLPNWYRMKRFSRKQSK